MKHFNLLLFLCWLTTVPLATVFAQQPAAPGGKFVTVNGAKIYYEEAGQGEPLILLHGFGRTAADWKPFIGEYSKKYRVIAWDMRGHGRSTSPDTGKVFLHMTAAKDLLAFMDKLKLNEVKAVGHSSGGIIILNAAILEPDRFEAIIPVSAQVNFSTPVREFIRQNAKPEDYYQFNELEQQHGKIKGQLIARQFYHFHELAGDPVITAAQLATIQARTLIVHGDNDFIPLTQALEMHRNIPSARLWIVPNGWHMPHLGAANETDFSRRTLEFLGGEWEKER